VNIGYSGLDGLQDFNVRVAVNRWVKAAEKSDFGSTDLPRFYSSFDDLIDRQKVGRRIVLSYTESAKTARPYADVCKVDVSIYDVAYVFADAPLPDRICDSENCMEVSSTHVEQMEGVVFVDSITALSFFKDVRQSAYHDFSSASRSSLIILH
jgi:hypothetical protein